MRANIKDELHAWLRVQTTGVLYDDCYAYAYQKSTCEKTIYENELN